MGDAMETEDPPASAPEPAAAEGKPAADGEPAPEEKPEAAAANDVPAPEEEPEEADFPAEGEDELAGDAPGGEEPAAEEGPETEAKAGEDGPAKEVSKTTTPEELEKDAEPDDRERMASPPVFSDFDATLDVFISGEGTIVSSLSQGGFQHLLSGVRASAGAVAGRYLFEVKILEFLPHVETALRVGFSTSRSSLFLADGTADSVCFDYEGNFLAPTPENPRRSRKVCKTPLSYKVVGVVLNLVEGSPNVNTISIFLDGVRQGKPQSIPSHLLGKALYPTLTFKNMTLAVNLGAGGLQMRKLTFTCRMFGDIAAADAEASSLARPTDGKYSVVVPVGLPEEGFFDYVDHFLEDHPEYVELSDRKIMDWCLKSGLTKKVRHGKWSQHPGYISTRDRPTFFFGIPSIDNKSLRTFLGTLVMLSKRHFLVAENQAGLLVEKRKELLRRFSAPQFSVVAHCILGEPAAGHKGWVHSRIRAAATKRRNTLMAKRQKNKFRGRPGKEDAGKEVKAAKEETKDLEKESSAKTEPKEEDAKGAEAKDEAKVEGKDEVKEEAKDGATEGGDDMKAEPEEEGKQDMENGEEEGDSKVGPEVWYVPKSANEGLDVSEKIVNQYFNSFALPSEEEGFQSVVYAWTGKAEAEEHLRNWIADRKASTVIDGLSPSSWFKDKLKTWKQALKEMERRQKDYAAKHKQEKKPALDAELPECLPETDLHVTDTTGAPMYAQWQQEDWILLSWRYELHLLAHSFMEDAKDSEALGVPEKHLAHYYKLYFGGSFSPRSLGCASLQKAMDLVADSLRVTENGRLRYLTTVQDKSTELVIFVRATEEARRDRVRRIEAGEESARLKVGAGAPYATAAGGDRPRARTTKTFKGGKGSKAGKDRGEGKAAREPERGGSEEGGGGKGSRASKEGEESGGKSGGGRGNRDAAPLGRSSGQKLAFRQRKVWGKGRPKGRGKLRRPSNYDDEGEEEAPARESRREPPQREAQREARQGEKRGWEGKPWRQQKHTGGGREKEPLPAWERRAPPAGAEGRREGGKGGRRAEGGEEKRQRTEEVLRRPRATAKSSLGPPGALPPRPPPIPGSSSRGPSSSRPGGKGAAPPALPPPPADPSRGGRPGGKPFSRPSHDGGRRDDGYRDRSGRDFDGRPGYRERSPPPNRGKGSGKGYSHGGDGGKGKSAYGGGREHHSAPPRGGKGGGGGGGGHPHRAPGPPGRDRDRAGAGRPPADAGHSSKGGGARGYDRERRR